MTYNNLSLTLQKLLKLGTYAIVITPFVAWDRVIYPLVFPRTIYFQIVIEILLFLYVALCIIDATYLPRATPLLIALAMYIGIITITSIFGDNIYQSFFSNAMRSDGVILLLHLLAYFVIITSVFRKREDYPSLLFFVLIIFFLQSLIALGQAMHIPYIKTFGNDRPNGTLGNPAYFASFILFGIWLSLFFLEKKPKDIIPSNLLKATVARTNIIKVISVITLIAGCITLYLTENRGGTLALVVSAFLYGILQLISEPRILADKKFRRIFRTSLIFIFFMILIAPKNGILQKLTFYPFNDVTIENRLISWEIGWKGFSEKPFFGYGHGNYNQVFDKYFNPKIIKDPGSYSWYDKPHNIIIENMISGGILALLSYLALFAVIFFSIYKSRLETRHKNIMASLVLAYGVQNFFIFDTINTYVVFFTFLGYINSSRENDAKNIFEEMFKKIKFFFLKKKEFTAGKIAVSFVIMLIITFYLNIAPTLAFYYSSKIFFHGNMKKEEVIRDYERAFFISSPRNQELSQGLGGYLNEKLHGDTSIDEFRDLIVLAVGRLNESADADPKNIKTRLILAELARIASPANKELLLLAQERAQEALNLSPKRYHSYFAMGKIKYAQGKKDEAISYFQKVLEINHDFLPAHFNMTIVYVLDHDIAMAESEIKTMKSLNALFLYNPANLLLLGGALEQEGYYKQAIELYQEGTGYFPKNTQYYLRIQNLAERTGQQQLADEAKTKILELEPPLK